MKIYLWVALGSALGGVARHWFSTFAASRSPADFPWGTLVINLAGSLLIGAIAALPPGKIGVDGRTFLMVGVLGGFTTFSAFSLQTVTLFTSGHTATALLYILVSTAGCPLLAWLGWRAVQAA